LAIMSNVPAPVLPLTGGVVVAGASFGLGWVAAAGLALVLLGFVAVRLTSAPGRRRA
jgi:hypothetical protein